MKVAATDKGGCLALPAYIITKLWPLDINITQKGPSLGKTLANPQLWGQHSRDMTQPLPGTRRGYPKNRVPQGSRTCQHSTFFFFGCVFNHAVIMTIFIALFNRNFKCSPNMCNNGFLILISAEWEWRFYRGKIWYRGVLVWLCGTWTVPCIRAKALT